MKSILITDDLHKRLKEFSDGTGLKIKAIVEDALSYYMKHVCKVENKKEYEK